MNNDLISRGSLKKEMLFCLNQEITKYKTMRRALGNVGRVAIECVEEVPAVDAVEVRHGRWGRFGKTHHRIVCSACKFPTPFKKQANGYHLAWKSNYCPNCGAKMEQVDD